jgi:hypothetical protein
VVSLICIVWLHSEVEWKRGLTPHAIAPNQNIGKANRYQREAAERMVRWSGGIFLPELAGAGQLSTGSPPLGSACTRVDRGLAERATSFRPIGERESTIFHHTILLTLPIRTFRQSGKSLPFRLPHRRHAARKPALPVEASSATEFYWLGRDAPRCVRAVKLGGSRRFAACPSKMGPQRSPQSGGKCSRMRDRIDAT